MGEMVIEDQELKRTMRLLLVTLTSLFLTSGFCQSRIIRVSLDGKSPYSSIAAALSSIAASDSSKIILQIGPGVYREKLYVTKDQVSLQGSGMNKTIIISSIARDEWRCEHPDDWGVATLNVGASDITLSDLSVINDVGFNFVPKSLDCPADTLQKTPKQLRKDGHQMAVRTMNGATRMKAIRCKFSAYGGDTMSPWNTENGLWYFKDCIMEGGVDFFCPRGWSWAEDCTFISLNGPAAIWHDGSGNEDSKSVWKHCTFLGYDGFLLGRYHRDAQFYLVDCQFGKNMRDQDIYLVSTTNTIRWGRRIYYASCKKEGKEQFNWYADNLPEGLKKEHISLNWIFGDKWQPKEK